MEYIQDIYTLKGFLSSVILQKERCYNDGATRTTIFTIIILTNKKGYLNISIVDTLFQFYLYLLLEK